MSLFVYVQGGIISTGLNASLSGPHKNDWGLSQYNYLLLQGSKENDPNEYRLFSCKKKFVR